ncbi:MAG TPA: serine hydrolase [Bryobacteraceae bacterium]|jgi:CubicO group peptidase (beta-lactamase class C family)|nr:serine hydrolase [Bryobacteraceae bacterium]
MVLSRALLFVACAGLACAQSMNWSGIPPAEAGLDATKLEAWRSSLEAHHTTGLLVIRRGQIALEWYAPEWDEDRPHGTASMAKALVGGMSLAVAMSDRRISPDDRASKYITGWSADPLKSKITIRQLATHTSGISDAEQDDIPHDQLPGWKGDFWKRTPDPFSIAIRQAPVLFEPGTQNAYSNPGMAALSYAITASLRGGDIRTMLKERVLDPLDVPERHWSIGYGRAYEVDGLKLYANWGGANFSARAAARVGQLMMLQGQWNGRELIRREVVKQVLADQEMPRPARRATDPAPASGLAWYTNQDGIWPAAPRDTFAGAGASHQVIVVAPSLDLIVVRNGDALGDTKAGFWGPVYELVVKPLMEAVKVRAPYPPSPVIHGAAFGKETRRDAIDSDNWPLTWGDDDQQYTSYGDGFGFAPHVEKKLGMGFARITGGPGDYRGVNLRSDGERTGNGVNSPKASGILMVDSVLYLWVRNVGNAQLLWSGDRGKTWQWGFKMETGFGSPAFLNFGRNYAGARDGFVYTYSQDGPSAYESDNGLILARVAKDRIRDRGAWEFFQRLDAGGRPVWTADVTRRGAVFAYPANCNRVDAVYDAGIGRYLMALGYDHAGGWGLFDAPEPWGPWTTVVHRQWDVADTHGYRLPSKWISEDGLTMTLVFSGVKPNDAFCTRSLTLAK